MKSAGSLHSLTEQMEEWYGGEFLLGLNFYEKVFIYFEFNYWTFITL